MRASKGRFALAVVSTLLTCLLTGISSVSSSVPVSIASNISQSLGYGPIESGAPSMLALVLTIVAMVLIYRFGATTIKAWDAPPRVSDIELAENHLENSIPALVLEQVKLITRRQKDLLASDAVANWKEKISETPKTVANKLLLKDMLVSAFNEIKIPDDGWRDDGRLWVGEKLGLRAKDTKPIIVFVWDARPTSVEIEARLKRLEDQFDDLAGYLFFAIFMSGKGEGDVNERLSVLKRTVVVLSSRALIIKSLDLRSYARELIDSFEKTRVGGTLATLKSSYVELLVDTDFGNDPPQELSEKLKTWLIEPTREHIALTGEYGQGKSTALLKFCYDWATEFVETGAIGDRVPLLIELRGQNPSEADPLGFISPWCARYRLLPQQVLNLIKAGDAVIIFEGFDELRNAGRAFYRHQHFNSLWRFAYPGTKIIFTGRPNFFLDQEEANRTLRSQENRRVVGDAFTSVWRLKKLEPQHIVQACRGYDAEVREGIKAAIEVNEDFLDIVSRPSMLPVVATIWADIDKLQRAGVTLTGAILIDKYIQAVFSRKEAELEKDRVRHEAPPGSRYLVLPKEVRELFTICVAWRMAGMKAKNTLARSEIVEMVRELYDLLMSTAKSLEVSPTVAAGLIEFEKRFADETAADRVEAISAEICSAGLLIPDAVGGASNLRFPHKQFYEFLIAKGVAIKTSPICKGATAFLDRSTNDPRIVSRLTSEPNSVSYLAECVGADIDRIVPRGSRLILRMVVGQMILFYKSEEIVNSISKYMSRALGTKNGDQMNSNRNDLEVLVRRQYMTFTLMGITISSIPLVPFLLLDLKEMPSNSGYGALLFVSGFVVLSLCMVVFLARFLSDKDYLDVIMNFCRTHWNNEGVAHETRIEELRLAHLSLYKGHVQFDKMHEDSAEYEQFLYPACEFGGERISR